MATSFRTDYPTGDRIKFIQDHERMEREILDALQSANYLAEVASALPESFRGKEREFANSVRLFVANRRSESWAALVECKAESVLTASLQLAALGLFPSHSTQDAFLIPRKNKSGWRVATACPGIRGYEKLIFKTLGSITQNCTAAVVRRQDVFKLTQGSDGPRVLHEPCFAPEEGKNNDIIAAFAMMRLTDGRVHLFSQPICSDDIQKERMTCEKAGEYIARRALYREVARQWCHNDLTLQKALALERESESMGEAPAEYRLQKEKKQNEERREDVVIAQNKEIRAGLSLSLAGDGGEQISVGNSIQAMNEAALPDHKVAQAERPAVPNPPVASATPEAKTFKLAAAPSPRRGRW